MSYYRVAPGRPSHGPYHDHEYGFRVRDDTARVAAYGRRERDDVRLVESVIALSISWVAIENLVVREHRRRWLLAFAFGLLHGFGFSNVLREMAIPRDVLGWSLASFNVGVEVGQVTIVAILYSFLAWSRRQRWSAWAVRAASGAIGIVGLYWFVERAFIAS